MLIGTAGLRAENIQYKIQPADGKAIHLEVEKTGLMRGKKHDIVFPKYYGTLSFDEKAPENSRVELTIDPASLQVWDKWLSEKDQKKVRHEAVNNLLAVTKFPQMRFASTRVAPAGGNRYTVEGTLTVKGIGRPVTLEATFDPSSLAIAGKGAFKMTAYGLKPPSAGLGTVGTKDEMTVTFDVAASK